MENQFLSEREMGYHSGINRTKRFEDLNEIPV